MNGVGFPGPDIDGYANHRRRCSLHLGTVLALPRIRVTARWISCSRVASIEMSVTGMAWHRSLKEVSRCTHRIIRASL